VVKAERTVYAETLPAGNQPRVFSQQNSNDLSYALSQVGSAKMNIGWDTAGKTGTWEFSQQSKENAHAWMVGYSKKLAAAVWVGNKAEEQPLRNKGNAIVYGSGVPADVWRKFMTNATKAINAPKQNTRFKPPNYAGDVMPDGAVPGPGDRNGNGNGNGGGGGGDGGGIFTFPPGRQTRPPR
jgi:membrane peptidoglycan carboxypeptidase